MKTSSPRLLFWEGVPDSVPEYTAFRKLIKEFKRERALQILRRYFRKDVEYRNRRLYRYVPQDTREGKGFARINVGLYSTVLGLEVIASYREELGLGRDQDWAGHERKHRARFLEFLVLALEGRFQPGGARPPNVKDISIYPMAPLPKASALDKIHDYLQHWDLAEDLDEAFRGAESNLQGRFCTILSGAYRDIDDEIEKRAESLHPYALYKFLNFIDKWKMSIYKGLAGSRWAGGGRAIPESASALRNALFDRVYFLGKYELYRQMALKVSTDSALYDPKRLAYSLLVVTYRNRFSNNLIRDNALEMLFEPQRETNTSVWPTGQLLPIGRDSSMAISSIELMRDLVHAPTLIPLLGNYLPELKALYDFLARTMQFTRPEDVRVGSEITGWYPPEQRDKTPASFVTALALSFIKGFCKLVSRQLAERATAYFELNRRQVTVRWRDIYDSTAAKCKLQMLIDSFERRNEPGARRLRSAILHGPPGTGKTTLARAVAQRLGLDYLELTPSDFFSGGEQSILRRISDIFENLQHLQDAVVFIDEIDDLVRQRGGTEKGPFDPRELYVNTLLPRFQELRDRAEIVLILGTNNFALVDSAIRRLGRIDLLIPVGPLSPPGRLTFLMDVLDQADFRNDANTRSKLGVYLKKTERMTYSELKVLLRDAMEGRRDPGFETTGRIGGWQVSDEMNGFCEQLKSQKIEARPKLHKHDFYEEGPNEDKPYDEVSRVVLAVRRARRAGIQISKPNRTIVERWIEEKQFCLLSGIVDELSRTKKAEDLVSRIKKCDLRRKLV